MRPRRRRRAVAGVALAGVLTACAATPKLPPAAADASREASAVAAVAAVAPNTAARVVAEGLDIHTGNGRLSAPQREALLKRLAAQGKGSLLKRQLAAMSALGEKELIAGNRTQLLVDGPATFASMFKAIDGARRSVLVESYIVEDAEIAQRFADALKKKRAQGLHVALMYDAVGSIGTDKAYFDSLRQAGVQVCAFNPLAGSRPRKESQPITERDHRKIVAVDGEVAFTGGINISAVYSSGSAGGSRPKAPARAPARAASGAAGKADEGWRDTQVRVQGPAATRLGQLVRDEWAAQGCEGALGPPHTAPRADGPEVVQVVPTNPDDAHSRFYTLLMTAIDTAQRSIHITMAYFAPGDDMVQALCDAAARGVDVQLVLPSRSDFAPVLHAGRAHYDRLLGAGVKLHEFQDAVLHAKTAVIDGVWSTVGSSNLDFRSFTANNEVNLLVLGEDFGAEMERLFARDVKASRELTLAQWKQRPLSQRFKERVADLFEHLW